MAKNPFTPTFGTVPPILAGRDAILEAMRSAFESGPGNPNLSTILVGARGTGKTALLSCICDVALEYGWVSASTSAMPGMLEDIVERAVMAGNHLIDPQPHLRITSVSAGPFSASWDYTDIATGNWRTRMTALLEQLAEHGAGLVIAVDEVRASLDEMSMLATVYQHFVREGRKVALVMAGLPFQVHRLVSSESVSFLRRSRQHDLSSISDAEVRTAFRRTVEGAEGIVDENALDLCVQAIGGFPYMLQLVGYQAWIESGESQHITLQAATRATSDAASSMEHDIIEATVRELSEGDLRFLGAMLDGGDESSLADIARRMGVKPNYAGTYKSRLLAQGVLEQRSRGSVAFAIPGLREYLEREKA